MSSALGTEIGRFFAERAAAVDCPEGDTRPGVRFLASQGPFGAAPGSDGGPETIADYELIEAVAAECLSSAFSAWGHRMALEYLARGRQTELTAELADGLQRGAVIGSSAMSTALRDLAGFEPLPLVAEPDGAGLRLDGRIPWASNLFDDAVVVAPARTPDGGRVVVAFRADAPGVHVRDAPELLAMNGTASSSVKLEGVQIGPDAVLSRDLEAFCGGFRPTFLLFQTAFCTGVAGASLAQAGSRIEGPNGELADDLAAQRDELAQLRDAAVRYGADTLGPRLADFISLRLDAARLAVSAARLEATVTGGAGYVADSPASRRLRETAFLPIQSPTEGHLRWELRHSR